MSHDDVCILTPILLAAITALIVIRQTFRSTSTARDAVVTPPGFAVIGGLAGISVGMIWLSDDTGRVVIEKGVPALLCGIVVGTAVGFGAREVYSRLRQGKAFVYVLVVTLLGASIGAPVGWLAGSTRARNVYEHQQMSMSGMMWGIVIGSGVGFLVGLPEVLFRRSEAT
jgi:hypothetical protein